TTIPVAPIQRIRGPGLAAGMHRYLWRAGVLDDAARAGNWRAHDPGGKRDGGDVAGIAAKPGNDCIGNSSWHRRSIGSRTRVAIPGGRNAAHRDVDICRHDTGAGAGGAAGELSAGKTSEQDRSDERAETRIGRNEVRK